MSKNTASAQSKAPSETMKDSQNLQESNEKVISDQPSQEFDHEEDISSEMTASYSEITLDTDHKIPKEIPNQPDKLPRVPLAGPSRPYNLPAAKKQDKVPLHSDGQVHYENEMTHYVADDLEFKIKLASPIAKKGETPVFGSRSSTPQGLNLYRQILAPQIGQIDITVLNDIEHEAQKIAQSVDSLIENLSNILHSNSTLTADNMEIYRNAVGKTCDAMDGNIKSMYTILAKGEEVSHAMISVQAQAARIAEIKRLLQIFESNL